MQRYSCPAVCSEIVIARVTFVGNCGSVVVGRREDERAEAMCLAGVVGGDGGGGGAAARKSRCRQRQTTDGQAVLLAGGRSLFAASEVILEPAVQGRARSEAAVGCALPSRLTSSPACLHPAALGHVGAQTSAVQQQQCVQEAVLLKKIPRMVSPS